MERSTRSKFIHTQIHQSINEVDMWVENKELCRKHGISGNNYL